MVIFFLLFSFFLHAETDLLTLNTIIEPPPPYYPGQKFLLGYEIGFKGSLALTKQELPFLTTEAFQKIGETVGEVKEVDGVSKQRFYRYFRATKPGSFSFPLSFLEAVSYKTLPGGKKEIGSEKITAQIEPLVIDVLSFPQEGQFKSFNGALGVYTIAASLFNEKELQVFTPFTLRVTLKGEGEFETISFPDLLCQRDWRGFFSLVTPPKLIQKTNEEKTYSLNLIPLSDEIKAIPPIRFSFFNPEKGQFSEVMTDRIQVSVKKGGLREIYQEERVEPFYIPPLTLILTGLIATLPYFYRSPFSFLALLPFLINLLLLIFQ
jgi:hypothetical protein